jgi:hypothetical protein
MKTGIYKLHMTQITFAGLFCERGKVNRYDCGRAVVLFSSRGPAGLLSICFSFVSGSLEISDSYLIGH